MYCCFWRKCIYAFRAAMTRFVIAKIEDVSEGEKIRVLAGKRALVLVQLDGAFYALADRCPHAGASLANGRISGIVESDGPGDYQLCRQGEMIKCPWHGWEFDIKTGQSWSDPQSTRARSFTTKTVSGTNLVKGPYVAETIPVSVEGDYVVVDI